MQAKKFLSIAIQSAIFAAIVPSISFAQDDANSEPAAEDAVTLDTIKVTARKREEELLEVPLSVTAIGEAQIEKLGLESINDIAKFTPGFSFRSGFGREGDRPVIRGQSNIQGEANAAFFIDGVFVNGNISGYGLDNLERVEVIRGPQAALFGRRTFSGAVNFITKRPSNEPEAKVTLTAATDSEREVSAIARGALVDDFLKFQFNTRYYQYGGQWENGTNGIKDLGGQRTASVGGTLYFTPTDFWESTVRLNYTSDQDEHYAIGRVGDPLNLAARGISARNEQEWVTNVLNCDLPAFTGATTRGVLPFSPLTPVSSNRARGAICGNAPYPVVLAANTGRFQEAGFKPGLDRDRTRFNWSNDFTTEGGWTFTSISAYNKSESLSVVDQDYSSPSVFPFPFNRTGQFETVDFGVGRDYSQEFRLASPTDSSLRTIVGYYLYRETTGDGFSADMTTFVPATSTRAVVLPVRSRTNNSATTNNALFGMLEYDWTEAFTSTFELRLADDNISISGRSVSTIAPTGAASDVRLTRSFDQEANYDSILPRFTLSYDLSDDMHIYVLAAKGNKPGGFNSVVQSANLSEAARAFLTGQGLGEFEEERATTYELGFKGNFLDDALSLSSALYAIDWTNQQLTESTTAEQINGTQLLLSYTKSIGKSRVTGLELEANWRLTDRFNTRFTYARTDGEIRDYFSQDIADARGCGAVNRATGCGSARGNDLPRVAPNAASVNLEWNDSLSNGWNYFASLSGAFESSRFTQIENNIESGSCKDVGVRAGLEFAENLTATVFVRNALNDECIEDVLRYVNPQFGTARPAVGGDGSSTATVAPGSGLNRTNLRDYAISPSRLRQSGITVNYRF
jgi:iron complex outermembrane recepter protein